MKIIATTGDGFLIEASALEIAQLRGFRNLGDMERNRSKIVVGGTVDVTALNTTAEYLRGVSDNELQRVAHDLEGVIKNINGVRDVVNSLNIFETIKEVSDE